MSNLVNGYKVLVTMATTMMATELWSAAKNDQIARVGAREMKSSIIEQTIIAIAKEHLGREVTVCYMLSRVEIVGADNALIVFEDGSHQVMTRTEFMEQW